MVLTFPHLGNVFIPVKAMLDDIGAGYVIPSFDTFAALETGMLHVPEFACMPLKITVGNISDGFSKGADTVLMVGGRGPCRFGYYCEMQRQVMESMKKKMAFILLDNPSEGLGRFLKGVKTLIGKYPFIRLPSLFSRIIKMIVMVDEIEGISFRKRAIEADKGETDMLYRSFRRQASEITGTLRMLEFLGDMRSMMEAIRTVPPQEADMPLRVGIIGEIYTTIETSSSFDIQYHLGRMGVVTDRKITVSSWVLGSMLKNILSVKADECYKKASNCYIGDGIGGHARETVGNYVIYAQNGYDGVIHIFPMGCMPEIAAKSVLASAKKDCGIPLLHLVIDEMTGEAGIMTRLEAFVDLMLKRRQSRIGGILPRY